MRMACRTGASVTTGLFLVFLALSSPSAFAAAPTITSISPNNGAIAGGNKVTIFGTNLQLATSVTFGGTAGTIAYNPTTGDLWPTVPAHAAGTVNVAVTTPGGTVTSTNGYTYVTASTGTLTGTVQDGVTNGVISGASVSFNGSSTTTNASGVYTLTNQACFTSTLTVSKSGYITATPSYSLVACPGTSTKNVILTPIPTITSISPNSGPTSGGNKVTILGAHLSFATSVTFGGTAATFGYNATTGDLEATAPSHVAGAVAVTVTIPNTLGVTSPGGYTYVTASTGTLTGTVQDGVTNGVISGASVSFNGSSTTTNASGVYTLTNQACFTSTLTVSKSGYITATPSYSLVACPGTSTKNVILTPIPTITSISPNSGPTSGGNKVTILGAHLSFATSVTFGGTAATFGYNATTGDLEATAPSHVAGAVAVTVTIPNTLGVTSPGGYTYVTASTGTLTGTVQDGVTNGVISGASVSFNGSSTTTNASGVYTLTNQACFTSTLTVSKSGYITATPSYSLVACPGTSTKNVILTPIPTITSISPNSGPTSGGNKVTILGAHLSFATSVTFGGTAATF